MVGEDFVVQGALTYKGYDSEPGLPVGHIMSGLKRLVKKGVLKVQSAVPETNSERNPKTDMECVYLHNKTGVGVVYSCYWDGSDLTETIDMRLKSAELDRHLRFRTCQLDLLGRLTLGARGI